jgi:recombination protein RecT
MNNTDIATVSAANKPPIVVLRERLESRRDELKNSLPSDISPERFIRAIITAAQVDSNILACTWQSLWLACMRACRDGLLPDGREGAIIAFKSSASFVPMYAGLLKRFRRSGQFHWIKADVVRQGEEFYHFVDENGEHIRHVPGDSIEAPITRVYALARTRDGGLFATVMPIAEVNKIRAMSRATREDSPWNTWFAEMAKKTALRRLSKVLPSEGDMPDDDLPEYDPPAMAPQIVPTHPPESHVRGAAAALDQFAASASDADSVPRSAEDAEDSGAKVKTASTS